MDESCVFVEGVMVFSRDVLFFDMTVKRISILHVTVLSLNCLLTGTDEPINSTTDGERGIGCVTFQAWNCSCREGRVRVPPILGPGDFSKRFSR